MIRKASLVAIAFIGLGCQAPDQETERTTRALTEKPNVRVMHIGDSNTAWEGSYKYRMQFHRRLAINQGLNISGEGYWRNGDFGKPACPTYDDTLTPCAQALPGTTIQGMREWLNGTPAMEAYWPGYNPRLIFIMAGTNNVIRPNETTDFIVNQLRELVTTMAKKYPGALIFLAQLPPIYNIATINKTAENNEVIAVNGRLPQLIQDLIDEGYNLHWDVVRTYDALMPLADVARNYGSGRKDDTYHFNAAGDAKIGDAFYQALLSSDFAAPSITLWPDDSITSGNGLYQLIYQNDGNLVLYRTTDWAPLWHSATHGTSPGQVQMQMDGNLVVYDAGFQPVFSSGTGLRNWAARLALQDDGRLVIYGWDGTVKWARP
jgi:hypothetical protein